MVGYVYFFYIGIWVQDNDLKNKDVFANITLGNNSIHSSLINDSEIGENHDRNCEDSGQA